MAQLSLTSNTRHRACVMFRGLINNSHFPTKCSLLSVEATQALHFLQLSSRISYEELGYYGEMGYYVAIWLLRKDMVTTER